MFDLPIRRVWLDLRVLGAGRDKDGAVAPVGSSS